MVDTTDNRKVKQLIILGNGFDLTCGLKSQYADFYKTININRDYNALIHYANATMSDDNPNWADVENNLLKLFTSMEKYEISSDHVGLIFGMIKLLEEKYNRHGTLKSININDNSLILPVFYDYLRKEVSDFENRLSAYLNNQIDVTYLEKSGNLAVSLSLAEYHNELLRSDDEEWNEKFTKRNRLVSSGEYAADFLTFNYTQYQRKQILIKYKIYTEV